MTTRKQLFDYIREKLDTDPDYPFAKDSDIAIFRHRSNRKWFAAVIPQVGWDKLGVSKKGKVDVVDLKCDPFLSGSFRCIPGILPGYHMNKEHWVTVVLDGSVEKKTLWTLLNMSYELTAPKKRKK